MEGFSRAIEGPRRCWSNPAVTRLCVLGTAQEQHKSATQACSVAMTRWVDHPGGSGEPMGRCPLMSVDVVESKAYAVPDLICVMALASSSFILSWISPSDTETPALSKSWRS